MQIASLPRFVRVLFACFLVATGLLVVSCDGGGVNSNGDGSNSDGGTDTTPPSAPSELSASAEEGAVSLNWNAVSADDLHGYNVYRSTSSIDEVSGESPLNESLLSDTSYTDDGVSNGTMYHYVVTAVDGRENESDLSNEATATPNAGNRIAFISSRDTTGTTIYTISPNGSDPNQVASGNTDGNPAWSPSGDRIAFERGRNNSRSNPQIYTIRPDGSGLEQVTSDGGYDPTWSPDGIAFTSERDGSDRDVNREIYTIRPDSSGAERVTNNSASDSQPAWSPSGDRIAFESDRDGNDEIYTIRPDGTGLERVTNNGDSDSEPAWSPDGDRIAFISNRDGDFEVYTIRPDGTGLEQVTNNSDIETHPAWSADGDRIAFTSERDGGSEIYTIRPDGTGLKQVTENGGSSPAWRLSQ